MPIKNYFNDSCRILYFACVVKPLLGILLGINIFGKENIPVNLSQPFILVGNHNSHLDACTLMNLFSLQSLRHVRPVAAADYFMTNPLFSWFSTVLLNIIPIPRSHITKENNPITTMGKALEAGQSLIIFPEGSRGQPEIIQEFKSGIAHLIKKHPNTPVIPVFLKGMGRSLPKGEMVVIPFFCDVIIGTPRYYQGNKTEIIAALEKDMTQLSETLHSFIQSQPEAIDPKNKINLPTQANFGLQWISNELWETTQSWASSPVMPFILGVWAVCESVFWFILPDFLLFPMSIQTKKQHQSFLITTLLGSFIGVQVLWSLSLLYPDFIYSHLFLLPFTPATLQSKVVSLYQTHGMWAPLFQSISGVPAKVWIWMSTHAGLSQWLVFSLLVTISRLVRFTFVIGVGQLLGKINSRLLSTYWLVFLVIYLFLFFKTLSVLAQS